MLEEFFSPQSVAVLGASDDETKLGYSVMKNILQFGYRGRVFPVNPKAATVFGLPAYPTVTAVPEPVDLAVLVVPPQAVAGAVQQCVAKRVRGAICITAGFRESGPEGALRERQVMEIVAPSEMRLLGPNVVGVINTEICLNATFATVMPKPGNVSVMSQSGALCGAILGWAIKEDLGLLKMISLGNKADIDEIDVLLALADDRRTKVIAAYLEGVVDGPRFIETARQVTKRKPVVVVKSGRSSAGVRAVSSHTGTLAGSDAAYEAAFKQAGILRAHSMEELFDISMGFSYQPIPDGPRLAIVTNSGGPGILATDAVEEQGDLVSMASFSPETIEYFRQNLPPMANIYNPVDIIGDATSVRYKLALDRVLGEPGVDAVIVMLVRAASVDLPQTAQVIVDAAQKTTKPVLTSFMGGVDVEEGIRILSEGGVPNYPFPERAIAALAAMNRQRRWMDEAVDRPVSFVVDRETVRRVLGKAHADGRHTLGDLETRQVLVAYGLPTVKSHLAGSAEEAASFAGRIGYPVVLKIVSPDILHKSDVGGVRVGLYTADAVREAYHEIVQKAIGFVPDAEIWGVDVQGMVTPGREVIIGVSRDSQFGQLIMFGLGGIYVEVMKDVTFRVAPLTEKEAREMVREIRGYPLLAGVRGQPPADLEKLVECLLRVSQLVRDFPEIDELDINPLVLYGVGEGAVAVDSRLGIAG